MLAAPLGFAFFGSRGMRAVLRELVLFWPLLLYALCPRGQRSSGEEPV